MSLKKDKQKVLGEVFDDERIKTFLEIQPYGDMNADFHMLEKAYRGMNVDNFETFVKFFQEGGRDINATNEAGKTLFQIVSEHRLGDEYAEVLKKAGGQ
ncbi:PA4642 family protein [Pseudomaricurvus sp.]|uniref:PA4642 family protein n=1 Tax=Pseudomaricurvus sp. TaxID=2004510 RepID=UPI003F6BB08A